MPKGLQGFQKGNKIWLGKIRPEETRLKMRGKRPNFSPWSKNTIGLAKSNKTSFKKEHVVLETTRKKNRGSSYFILERLPRTKVGD